MNGNQITGNGYFNNIDSVYSDSLSNEIAELQRKIYLPLLPLERLTDQVLAAYRYNETYYWTKEDKFTAVVGNFFVSMLTPLIDNNESTELINDAPKTKTYNNAVEGSEYVTSNFIELVIPRYIVMQFSNVIPKGTKFNVTFFGGASRNKSMRIVSVADTVERDPDEFDDRPYETYGMTFDAICALVKKNLKDIEQEEARRRKEEESYALSRP